MFCPKCGKELPENSSFCDGCGSPVKGGAPVPEKNAAESRGGFFEDLKKSFLDILKNPKKLIPTAVITLIWLVFSLMSGLGANVPALRFLYALTYSNGGMFGGFFGAVGGIFGKAVFAAFINSIVLSLFEKKNPFSGMGGGLKIAFGSAAAGGLSAVSPWLIGGGAGMLLYWFFNITSSPQNCAIAVVGAVSAIMAAGRQNGILFSLIFAAAGKLSKGKIPSQTVISRFLTGFSAGFAVSFPITFARYPVLIFAIGFVLAAVGVTFALVSTGGRKAAAAMLLLAVIGSVLIPCAAVTARADDDDYETEYVPYNGRLTYSSGKTNKHGQPWPDLMDFDRDGDIDYIDRAIQYKLVHDPDYLDRPGNTAGVVAVSVIVSLLGGGAAVLGSAGGSVIGGAVSGVQDGVARSFPGSGEAKDNGKDKKIVENGNDAENAGGFVEETVSAPPEDLGPHIRRDADGDLVAHDPVTNEENTYVSNGDGTYTNPLTGATYTEQELKSHLDSRAENSGTLKQDAEQAKKAVEAQRTANQDESFYSTEARTEREAAEAKEREKAEHDAYVKKVGINHGVYVGDEKDVRKAVIRDQMENYQKGAEAEGRAEYMDAGYKTAKQTEKAADVALDVLEKFDKTGTAKLVKDGYQAGKAYGQGLMEVATGEKSFTGAMSAATVKTSAEIAKNHASDWAGGGFAGFAAEGTANITGDGVSATADALAKGKSLEKALKEGNKAAKQGAMNFAVDKTVDFVGGKVGDAVIGEGGGDVVGHLLDSEVTKDGVKEAASAFAADEIKNSLEDDD